MTRWCLALVRHLVTLKTSAFERERLYRIAVTLECTGAIFTDEEWHQLQGEGAPRTHLPEAWRCKSTGVAHVIAPDEAIPWEVEEDPTLATKAYDGTCMACGEGGFPYIEPPTKCDTCGALYSFRYECPRCDPVTYGEEAFNALRE